MKSTLRKVLAVAMMAAMIACVGAGCAKNDNNTQQSSTTSAASQASTESKAEESKKEESKEESKKEVSKKEESKEESKKEEESKTEESSEEESKTEESQPGAYDAIVGVYSITAGEQVVAMQLNADLTAAMQSGEAVQQGTWTVEEGKIVITFEGEAQSFQFVDNTLVSEENPEMVFVKQSGEQSEQPTENSEEEPGAYDAIVGVYAINDGEQVVAMQLNADLTAAMQSGEAVQQGTWTVAEGKIVITFDGEAQSFQFVDNTLVSEANPEMVFVKQAAQENTEENGEENGEEDVEETVDE